MTCQPSQYIMGLLIAGTLYGKINLGTRFVAVINRGRVDLDLLGCQILDWRLLCKIVRQVQSEIWSVFPLGGKIWISPVEWTRAGHRSRTFDYKLSIKSETRTAAGSTIAILQIFYGWGWSRFGEEQTPPFPFITHFTSSHFNPVLIIKFGISHFLPLGAHQGFISCC